jgi:hypothetical protein
VFRFELLIFLAAASKMAYYTACMRGIAVKPGVGCLLKWMTHKSWNHHLHFPKLAVFVCAFSLNLAVIFVALLMAWVIINFFNAKVQVKWV